MPGRRRGMRIGFAIPRMSGNASKPARIAPTAPRKATATTRTSASSGAGPSAARRRTGTLTCSRSTPTRATTATITRRRIEMMMVTTTRTVTMTMIARRARPRRKRRRKGAATPPRSSSACATRPRSASVARSASRRRSARRMMRTARRNAEVGAVILNGTRPSKGLSSGMPMNDFVIRQRNASVARNASRIRNAATMTRIVKRNVASSAATKTIACAIGRRRSRGGTNVSSARAAPAKGSPTGTAWPFVGSRTASSKGRIRCAISTRRNSVVMNVTRRTSAIAMMTFVSRDVDLAAVMTRTIAFVIQ
mmetsp:Transcript_23181/g.50398  ORF Transcript_23181/g.50398 Transcript_23181/m.50398 type:complete len:308 (+) Transcript_23181:451-1374(+)